jgi:alanine racemase
MHIKDSANRSLNPSHIVLDADALKQNIRFLQKRLKDGVRMSAVVKGNAYGHGISAFVPIAEQAGIDHFSVFSAYEAEGVLKFRNSPDTGVMIMGMIRDEELEWAIDEGLEFYLFEEERLKAAITAAKKTGKKARVHIQIETGMNRTGFEEDDWPAVFDTIKENTASIELKGVCTHFAGAETVANYFRIQNQNRQFEKALAVAEHRLGYRPKAHASSSAAFLTYPEFQYDMVRIGIAQYGFWPSRETYMHLAKSSGLRRDYDPLKRVLTWKSEVMSTKWVEEGEFIGYGNVYLAGRRMRIATVPIGYAHGFGRNLTNTGYVLINGERAGVVGLVNMNMITVDITDIEGAEKGSEVVLIGRQGKDEITVASFGEMTNNLNYEVLVRLPAAIPRHIFQS